MKIKFVGGILVLLAVAGIVWVIIGIIRTPPVAVVNGYTGASKVGLLNDPEVQEILRKNHGLEVKIIKVTSAVCDLAPADFFWPGNDVAVEEYEACNGGVKATWDSVLTSPLVFYSWDMVTDALVRQKLVERRGDVYYANDMPRLMRMLVERKVTWKDLGLSALTGKVAVIPADPLQADSGHLFVALMANTLLDDVATTKSLPTVLPDTVAYIKSLGFLQPTTGALFSRFNNTGMGEHPVIAAYESMLPDFVHKRDLGCPQLGDKRVIYPEPTVWASHPLIYTTENGRKLMEALRDDKDIQRLAWEHHGFRTPLLQIDPAKAVCVKMPEKIDTTTRLPDFKTMNSIFNALLEK